MNDFSENVDVSLKDELDLRAALQDAISQICEEEEISSSPDDDEHSSDGHGLSADGVVALAELVFQYSTKSLSSDLILFSKHAGRRTVQVDDVLLAARKDPDGLLAKLRNFGANAGMTAFRGSTKTAKSSSGSRRGAGEVDLTSMTPTTERMQAWRERLEREDIDLSSVDNDDDDKTQTDDEMDDANKKQAARESPKQDKVSSFSNQDSVIQLDNSFDFEDLDTAATKENDETNQKDDADSKDPFDSSDDDDEKGLGDAGLKRLGKVGGPSQLARESADASSADSMDLEDLGLSD